MEEVVKAKKETSASNDESKIAEMGYFYLAQQLSLLMQAQADMRRELKADISDLKAEINNVKTEINNVKTEINNIKAEMNDLRTEVKTEVNGLRLWVASSAIGILAIIATMLGYLLIKG
jgi:septal ring factor EnvC (AmiA/AmiB activator)